MNVKKNMDILGLKVQDKVTNFAGVVESISFDLYGCIQCVVKPPVNDNGEVKDASWFDISRLTIMDHNPVMNIPNFDFGHVAEGKHGCSEKPL